MRRQDVINTYTIENGRITTPGRFEGEPIFLPALWELAMEGLADDEVENEYRFTILAGDPLRTEFPELNRWLCRQHVIRVWQNDSGFIGCARL